MKSLKLLFTLIISFFLFTSCAVEDDYEEEERGIVLEYALSDYDLWYVDYHRTTGSGDVPFLSRAFTISFINGTLYANNNIVDIGHTGNGFGISVGTYTTFDGVLATNHDVDGFQDFEVFQISANQIRLYNYRENVSYYLIGYQVNNFDYDKLFYENIEYFLQEFVAWEKIETLGGAPNAFDAENYLQFTPENTTTFYSSQDMFGTNIDTLDWSYVGGYEVFDVIDYEDLKILTLNYDGGDIEEFELSVINDETISFYHLNTATTYEFSGRGFIQYLKGGEKVENKAPAVRNSNRKRTKVKRRLKMRRNLK
jgi:hypothetical protein|tara:strand:+ start:2172 stop:3104 length:933 start_codon:yes stop_codon:yes gene_type:complete